MALGILVQADEEIEIKQMRKQQVPRAHPMPDFSKPFVPKRYRISSPCASSMMICQHFFSHDQPLNLSTQQGLFQTDFI
jgi:hypothetical protein